MYFQEKSKPLELFKLQGLEVKNPGGDLLLRDLSSDYHWRGSVSLPGSERDRVGPLRSGHRASGGRVFIDLHPACPAPLLGVLFFGGDFLVFVVCGKEIFFLFKGMYWEGGGQRKLTSAWLVVFKSCIW